MNTPTLSPLRFITLRRLVRNRWEDTTSLAIDGRSQTPGMVQVIGDLPHCAEIAPRTEADRLALVAWLESDACKAVARNPGTVYPQPV